MTINLKAIFLEEVVSFIESLDDIPKSKILAAVKVMTQGDFQSVHIKSLRGPIKELIVKRYRVLFFINQNTLYVIGIFVKKTQKTPAKEIEQALKIYKQIVT